MDTKINTNRLCITEAVEEDISAIISLEEHKENRDFLWIGTRDEHLAEIADPDHLLLVFRTRSDDRLIGYALVRLDFKSEIFELRRIAISEKGKGFGKESMIGLFQYAFEELGTNRFWLDVYPDNTIGIQLYEKLGMHRDGILRENYKAQRGYLDQIIYSILKKEYYMVRETWQENQK